MTRITIALGLVALLGGCTPASEGPAGCPGELVFEGTICLVEQPIQETGFDCPRNFPEPGERPVCAENLEELERFQRLRELSKRTEEEAENDGSEEASESDDGTGSGGCEPGQTTCLNDKLAACECDESDNCAYELSTVECGDQSGSSDNAQDAAARSDSQASSSSSSSGGDKPQPAGTSGTTQPPSGGTGL